MKRQHHNRPLIGSIVDLTEPFYGQLRVHLFQKKFYICPYHTLGKLDRAYIRSA